MRRWWLIRNRLISTIALSFIIPGSLTIVTVLGIKNIIVRSINGEPYEIWVVPGLFMVLSTLLITPLIYRDFFDLRIHHKVLVPLTLSPIRKSNIIIGILFSALLEALVVLGVGLVIYSAIFPDVIHLFQSILILFYSAIFAVLFGNIVIAISLLTERISVFISVIFTLIISVMFACGLFIEFNFYPLPMANFFRYIPLSMVGIASRNHLFHESFDIIHTVIPIFVSIILIIFNSYLLKRKMGQ